MQCDLVFSLYNLAKLHNFLISAKSEIEACIFYLNFLEFLVTQSVYIEVYIIIDCCSKLGDQTTSRLFYLLVTKRSLHGSVMIRDPHFCDPLRRVREQ